VSRDPFRYREGRAFIGVDFGRDGGAPVVLHVSGAEPPRDTKIHGIPVSLTPARPEPRTRPATGSVTVTISADTSELDRSFATFKRGLRALAASMSASAETVVEAGRRMARLGWTLRQDVSDATLYRHGVREVDGYRLACFTGEDGETRLRRVRS
jgi:hypothetical protein